MPKNTRKIVFLDPSLMAIIPVTDFIGKLPLQLRKAHYIQPLENVSAMCQIGDKLDIQLLSFLEELKGEVRRVPIKKNHPCPTSRFLTSGWIKILDKPV